MQHFIFLATTSAVLLVTYAPSALGTEYFVSNSGDDNNPGTSPDRPWRTLDKVNSFKFKPGDVIRFECGGVWRGQLIPQSGSPEGYITYTSYGEGSKPLLLGSVEKNKPEDWKQVAPNIYETGPFPVDVGNIIFNNGERCAVKVWSDAELDQQGKFYFDPKRKVVRLYSARNPAEMFDDIECALKRHIIDQGGKHHVIYDGLHLAYGAAHGIGGGGTHHIIVRNCDVCFIGGGHQFTRKTESGEHPVRYGNGIEFWNSAHDILVENCRIWDIYDAGLTNQGASKNRQYNIVYRNNVIWNCVYSFEYWNRPETSVTHDIYFENNICFYAGGGWSNGRGMHLMFFRNSAKTERFFVRNNIFHEAKIAPMVIQADDWNGLSNLILEGNVYYQRADALLVWWGHWRKGRRFLTGDFDAYKEATGKDLTSRLVTPKRLMVKPSKLSVRVNEVVPLKAILVYSDGTQVDVTYWTLFTSSNPAVAPVEGGEAKSLLYPPSPRVKGLRAGKATVKAVFEGLTASASVTVRRSP